jgi:hypothetical protein
MIEAIKSWMLKSRLPKPKSLSSVAKTDKVNTHKTIHVLYTEDNAEQLSAIHTFIKKLSSQGKTVRSLAFYNKKEAPSLDPKVTPFYFQKDINWFGMPQGEAVQNFLKDSCDTLIICATKMLPHIEYIIAHSKAGFVVMADLERSEMYGHLIVEVAHPKTQSKLIKSAQVIIAQLSV